MVEWKKMWEVTTWDKKFTGVDKQMQPKVIKYYYYLANELSELESKDGDIRILYTTDKVAYAKSEDVEDNISEGEVVTIPWGGNVCIKYYKGKFITADNRIATSNNTNILANKFLFYWMLSQKDEIEKFYRGAGIKHPSMLSVLSMSIPLPSLSEQERIVGILDTFTSSIENLKAQISLRRKQYEHYRDKLLDLEGKPGVEMKTLGEIARVLRGKRLTKNLLSDDAQYPVFHGGLDPLGKYGQFNRDANTVMVINVGASAGTVGFCDCKFWSSDGCFCISHSELINNKFLFYYLQTKTHYLQSQVRHAGIPTLDNPVVEKIAFPMINLQEQSRIVSILDEFEASIKNLEAQLEAREKQYEYYRNKLLTFE